MYKVLMTTAFSEWLGRLNDTRTRMRLARRLEKAIRGLLGDVVAVGDGVYEMREFFGPGWRMYYLSRAPATIVMVVGGDKSTQRQDIRKARRIAQQIGGT